MVNPSLIFSVRRLLNHVPEDYLSDDVIVDALNRADSWLNAILDPPDETYREHCLAVTAAYYVYVSYVTGLERAVGTMPPGATATLNEWRRLVYHLVRPYSKLPLREDLSIDEDRLSGPPCAVTLTDSNVP